MGRLIRLLRDAVSGTDEDFTSGSVRRAIALLAVPMVLEMSMESVFAVVDIFFVSKLGPDAVATVGLTEAVLTLVFAIAIGLSAATTAMIARRIGEKNREAAAVTAVQALGLGLVVSLMIGFCGVVGAPWILRSMGASAGVTAIGSSYTAILLGGSASVVLLFLGNAIFRGAGDAAIAMRVLWLANLINIVLDPCLIFGLGPFPELGVKGAAIATTLGRSCGVLLQLAVLARGNGRIAIARRHLRLNLPVAARLIRISFGGIVQWLVATASWMILVRIIAVFGSVAVAGYTIAVRIIIFTLLPAWGLANAAATLVGQNLGAGKPDRAERSVWMSASLNAAFLLLVTAVFLAFADRLVGLFTADEAIIAVGADCLRIVSYCYLFNAVGMVLIQAFNGAGDTTTPTKINVVCYWLVQIPLAYLLARQAGMGPRGVFYAVTVSELLLGVLGAWAFSRGRWKTREV